MSDLLENNRKGNDGYHIEAITHVSGMYQNWFLDYASYVILERAVPSIYDGLKPVQRRILHSLYELEDGRFHKVANVIGHTMKYHPHGDASIGDALVQVGQKDLLLDMQGNWGNLLTGDRAAAPRYIEVRLSNFAKEVVFSPKITNWQYSYDGRAKEPINLPVKFPLLLAQGVEGIAVGLSTKIMPHNFIELIDASIKVLKGVKPRIYPDFPTGGIADFSNYNDGKKGSRIKVRAKISILDKNTLSITEIPFSTTTTSLIDSIVKANEKGKIKIKNIEDNTAEFVEILIHLPPGISPDKTIDALYAFTNCEVSISPVACVVKQEKPYFFGVSDILKESTENTLLILKLELENRLRELQEQWHFSSLERIFIENRIYRNIEESESWEEIIKIIHKGLQPYKNIFSREITDEDIVKLTDIKIKRISKFDLNKSEKNIKLLEEKIKDINNSINNLVEYAIDYFKKLKSKYKVGKERKTEIKIFENIVATKVAIANTKIYVDKEEGFIGSSLRGKEIACECSDLDDIIVFLKDGKMMITKVASKTFVGKNILHVGVFKRNDKRTVYNVVYKDGGNTNTYVKRFFVTGLLRDREYHITRGNEGSKILYFSANFNGEAEEVIIYLRAKSKLKKLNISLNFAEIDIKSKTTKGKIITKHTVKKIELKTEGISTLKPRKIWFDDNVMRLNDEGRGELLGDFAGDDRILIVYQTGEYKTIPVELSTHFQEDTIIIEKHDLKKPISAIYFDGKKQLYYLKRFYAELTNNKVNFISESNESFLEIVTTDFVPQIELEFVKPRNKDVRLNQKINVADFISVKGLKAQGNILSKHKIKNIHLLEPINKNPILSVEELNNNISDEAKQTFLDFE